MKRYLIGLAAALLGTAMITGTGFQTASAAPADPVSTVTLPLFGAPLIIDITTGPGGALSNVAINSTGSTSVATHLRPNKVVFESSDIGDPTSVAKVVVKSKHGGQSVSARAGSLADVSGDGGWSGDLFGTGVPSTVTFTIGAGTDGAPDITNIVASTGGVVGDVKRSSGDDHEGDDDGDEQSARVSVRFTSADGLQSRTVTIKVKVETEDGETQAKLSISVSRTKGVEVDAALAVGLHTWTGTLCDNSAASIAYTINADGSVTAGAVTPSTATVNSNDNKIDVQFSDHERVSIKVRSEDGRFKVSVKERIRCDSADPTTNVSTSIPSDDEGDGHNNDGDHHDEGKHKGGHNNDNTSKTVSG